MGKAFGMRMVVVCALLGAAPAALLAQTPAPAPAAPAPAAPPPVEAFAQLPFVAHIAMSPDGQRMAGIFNLDGKASMCMISIAATAEPPRCLPVDAKGVVHWIQWVNNDNIVVRVGVQIPVGERLWYVERLFAVNRKTAAVQRLLWDHGGQHGADLLWVANDGSPDIVMATQSSVYSDEIGFFPAAHRVNVETGAHKVVRASQVDVFDWVADGSGQVRAGYALDDRTGTARVFYRSETGGLRVIDRANVRARESVEMPVAFIPGGEGAVVIRNATDKPARLVQVDMATQKDTATLYTAPEGSRIAAVQTGRDGAVLGVRLEGAQAGLRWLDPTLAEAQALFAKVLGDRRATILSHSDDRKKMLVRVDRADSPGALYYYDSGEGVLRRVAWFNEQLQNRRLADVSLARYKARDGLEIEAVLTRPQGTEGKRLPVVVMPHGGPWAHDSNNYDYWAQYVASLGYLVIQPNFRGSTGYGEAFERKGEGQLGLAMQDDLNDALNWAVAQGMADGKRACLVGASYGGYASLWGVVRDPGVWRCAVAVAPVTSLRRDVNDMADGNYQANQSRIAWERMTPDFGAVSPANGVARITAPVLFIHGRHDTTVMPNQSDMMVGRMRGAGKQVDYVQLPEADHYFARQADRLSLLQATGAFLQKHNPVP
ncbi:alpha/beta hydrolase family protein [Novosphingobium ovatum]|nr:S9 family peptidase [Novosphingobium ovatum]